MVKVSRQFSRLLTAVRFDNAYTALLNLKT